MKRFGRLSVATKDGIPAYQAQTSERQRQRVSNAEWIASRASQRPLWRRIIAAALDRAE